jgi:hypothetical protein
VSWRPVGVRHTEASTFSGQAADRWRWSSQTYTRSVFALRKISYIFSVTGIAYGSTFVRQELLGHYPLPSGLQHNASTTVPLWARSIGATVHRKTGQIGATRDCIIRNTKSERRRRTRYETFEVVRAVTMKTMKNAVFWDMTPCGSCKNRRFGEKYCLHH